MSSSILFIATPLEREHVDRIRAAAPPSIKIIYDPRILPPIRYRGDHHGAPFERRPEQQQRWNEGLAAAEILWDLPPTLEDAARARRLRWIQTTSTGVGQRVLDLRLQKTDVIVTTARGVHGGPLAEFVMMALLSHFRGLRHLEAEQRSHHWTRYCGEEVAGKTLVTIGAGDLARGTARVARALDMRVVAVTRDRSKSRVQSGFFDEVHATSRLHDMLGHADAVVITVPQTAEKKNLIDGAAFRAMKTGVALVNIGRGGVIDEPALIDALHRGHVGFAALDVTAAEPLSRDSRLWDMPNVLISPHSASTVTTENCKIVDLFCYNLRCYLQGDVSRMKNVLDKIALY